MQPEMWLEKPACLNAKTKTRLGFWAVSTIVVGVYHGTISVHKRARWGLCELIKANAKLTKHNDAAGMKNTPTAGRIPDCSGICRIYSGICTRWRLRPSLISI